MMPSGTKRQGGQTKEPMRSTGQKMQYRGKGRGESAAVQAGRPRLGRGGKRA